MGVDIDPEKIRKVNAGLPPVDEPLLAETMAEAKGRFRATDDPAKAVKTDVSFFIPPSPSLPDGSFSNEYLLKAMRPIAKAVREAGKKGTHFCLQLDDNARRGRWRAHSDAGERDRLEMRLGVSRLLQPGVHRAGQRHQRIARTGPGA